LKFTLSLNLRELLRSTCSMFFNMMAHFRITATSKIQLRKIEKRAI